MTTIAKYLGTFTRVAQADLDAIPHLGEDGFPNPMAIWKDPRIPNWKNESGEFLFPTVRDANDDRHLIIVLDDDNRVCTWGTGMLPPPPDYGSRLYALPELDQSSGDAFLSRIFDPETGTLSDPPPGVPASIERHQGLLALLDIGITEASIFAHIEAIEDPELRELTRIRCMQPLWWRDSEFIEWGEIVFNLTPTQTDALFVAAGGK